MWSRQDLDDRSKRWCCTSCLHSYCTTTYQIPHRSSTSIMFQRHNPPYCNRKRSNDQRPSLMILEYYILVDLDKVCAHGSGERRRIYLHLQWKVVQVPFLLGPMPASTLRLSITQLLGRFLKFLTSIRGLPSCRLINYLFAFFASLRRCRRANPCRPTLYQPQNPHTSLDNGIACAMNIPSPGPYERARPSPVGSPYTSARSPSGHLAPYPPARRYSRDYIPMTGSQTPLHDEPREIDHDTLQQAADSVLSSSSSTPILTHHDSHTSNSDTLTHPSHPPGPLHRTIGFAPEVVPGTSGVQSSPRAAHLHFDANNPQPPRSGTPLSMSSSRTFVSQNTHNSQKSTGRASYRVHCGTSARFQTPASNADAPVFDSLAPPTLGIAGPGGSAIPLTVIAPPNMGDSNRPGEPVHDGNKFRPLSVSDLRRYDHRNIR